MDIRELEETLSKLPFQHFAFGRFADGRWQASYRGTDMDGYSVGVDEDLATAIDKAFVGIEFDPKAKAERPKVPARKVSRGEEDDLI